jgi:hypothetical protein
MLTVARPPAFSWRKAAKSLCTVAMANPSPLRPALFLDRDGPLTRDAGYTFRVADLDWLPGAQEAIVAAHQRARW